MPPALPIRPASDGARLSAVQEDATTKAFFKHSSGRRTATDVVIAKSLKAQYPSLELLTVPEQTCNLLAFANAGNATYTPLDGGADADLPSDITWTIYVPPARRIDGAQGGVLNRLVFGKFLYKWQGTEFVVYLVDGRDGESYYPQIVNNYILTSDPLKAEALVLAAGSWGNELHEEVWVFDQGYWQKSPELYDSIRNASWDSVILDPEMKKSLIDDHLGFFKARESYSNLKVPWKRGSKSSTLRD
jgi:transitional endoplasmic reticulum ATPase